jgi:tRNA threonylcarbamoyladenosine biosynthesis protein TsaB
MKLLALDTSSIACSVALQNENEVIDRHEEQPREHTRLLMPMIEDVMRRAGIQLTDLDAIVLGNGPGSFIGMRIAASVAQGLAFGSGLNIIPVSSLAAVAAQVFDEHDATEVVVTQDAHMHEVYLGVYRRGSSGAPAGVISERLQAVGPICELETEPEGTRLAAGFGWQRYPQLLAENQDRFAAVVDVPHPRARHLLQLGAVGMSRGLSVTPQDVVPAYLRQKVAEKSTAPQ